MILAQEGKGGLCATVGAVAEEGEGMSFDGEVGLIPDGSYLFDRQADLHLDHAMTACAGEVMMVTVASAHTIVVGAIGKLDAVEQTQQDQLLDPAIDGGASQARRVLAQALPQIVHRKIRAALGKLDEALRNQAARAGIALACFLEGGANGVCFHGVTYWLLLR